MGIVVNGRGLVLGITVEGVLRGGSIVRSIQPLRLIVQRRRGRYGHVGGLWGKPLENLGANE